MENLNLIIENMPKIELHAHLLGSVNGNSMKEISETIYDPATSVLNSIIKNLADSDDIDYFKKFILVHELTTTKKGIQLATEFVIRDFAKENVVYLELRTTPKSYGYYKMDYFQSVLDTIIEAKTKYPTITVKLLPSIDRTQGVLVAEETLNIVLTLLQIPIYKNIIRGIDFCGDPQVATFSEYKPVLDRARKNNLPLAIHCAEIDNPHEIEEMLEFGMARCGHGIFLSEEQIMRLKAKKVPIECCLTSNVLCKTVTNYNDHHFKKIYNNAESGSNAVICTDNIGILNTTLTKEFKLAAETFKLNKLDLFHLTINAVDYSFMDIQEKIKFKNICTDFFN